MCEPTCHGLPFRLTSNSVNLLVRRRGENILNLELEPPERITVDWTGTPNPRVQVRACAVSLRRCPVVAQTAF